MIFIQARMSSKRFPGKIMSQLNGKPLIDHVYRSCCGVSNARDVVVLTSSDSSDDIMADYLQEQKMPHFRGELENVYKRFVDALHIFQPKWFVRICGDSPFIRSEVIEHIISIAHEKEADIITNVFKRTFPKGQSVEVINTQKFISLEPNINKPHLKEHVTSYYYENPDQFSIYSVENNELLGEANMCVDTPQDLEQFEIYQPEFLFNPDNTVCKKI